MFYLTIVNKTYVTVTLGWHDSTLPTWPLIVLPTCADPQRGGRQGVGTPEISQNIGFRSNTGPDPLK